MGFLKYKTGDALIYPTILSLMTLFWAYQVPITQPASLFFKNETPIPILIQVKSISNGKVIRDRPYVIKPGENSPPIQIPGTKSLSISDSKSLRPLAQFPLPQNNEELLIAIVGSEKSVNLELRKK